LQCLHLIMKDRRRGSLRQLGQTSNLKESMIDELGLWSLGVGEASAWIDCGCVHLFILLTGYVLKTNSYLRSCSLLLHSSGLLYIGDAVSSRSRASSPSPPLAFLDETACVCVCVCAPRGNPNPHHILVCYSSSQGQASNRED